MTPPPSFVRRALVIAATGAAGLGWRASAFAQIRPPLAADRAADEGAFADVLAELGSRWSDVESMYVAVQGRSVFEFYRDAEPERLRNVQSVEKSALSALVGVALRQGLVASLDQPVLALVPEWAGVNEDPRVQAITVRHLLTMTPGFDLGSATAISGKMPPQRGWARALAAAPGERFAYDNAVVGMLVGLLERVSGMALPEFARRELVQPLGMAEPRYGQLHLRTRDMAALGQLLLQQGRWGERQILAADYVADATRPQNRGGPPAAMPYGYLWWIIPGEAPRRTFLASGYAGQMIWVHPPLELVVAATSTISAASQQRGHALQMLRGGVVAAAQSRFVRG
ncbi:serine hydrolase domain-containing protein [Ramlibacter rhizophilus]|uniref:Class C beta-lactamase-related serine hydrolase n=1 Tax=Ramlibacter rhizophilus TaxID=1781167 RepID=A0A4Z0BK49_9BURK|nr:serine hydrolase [Ramlibacter rhizophilus]TFY98793.1 class C beta-lactamase-related serine hydrolase [Ramlibacter rhizophilus]